MQRLGLCVRKHRCERSVACSSDAHRTPSGDATAAHTAPARRSHDGLTDTSPAHTHLLSPPSALNTELEQR